MTICPTCKGTQIQPGREDGYLEHAWCSECGGFGDLDKLPSNRLKKAEEEIERLRAACSEKNEALRAYLEFHEWHMGAPSEDIIDEITGRRERLNQQVMAALWKGVA